MGGSPRLTFLMDSPGMLQLRTSLSRAPLRTSLWFVQRALFLCGASVPSLGTGCPGGRGISRGDAEWPGGQGPGRRLSLAVWHCMEEATFLPSDQTHHSSRGAGRGGAGARAGEDSEGQPCLCDLALLPRKVCSSSPTRTTSSSPWRGCRPGPAAPSPTWCTSAKPPRGGRSRAMPGLQAPVGCKVCSPAASCEAGEGPGHGGPF